MINVMNHISITNYISTYYTLTKGLICETKTAIYADISADICILPSPDDDSTVSYSCVD